METQGNIIIADESALHLYLHTDKVTRVTRRVAFDSPLGSCAQSASTLSSFNTGNPLYGGLPVVVLVNRKPLARKTKVIDARVYGGEVPHGSFIELREGLYVVSPELLFLRMAHRTSPVHLMEIGMNLCGRYYLDIATGKIEERSSLLASPESIGGFLAKVKGVPGVARGSRAVPFMLGNSGSPAETKTAIQYTLPYRLGGFGLPFDAMNLDLFAKPGDHVVEQSGFCIDLANSRCRFGLEYDGYPHAESSGHDKRRRNDLASLGWTIYPIDKAVLGNPEATITSAHQIAKRLGVRLRFPKGWEDRYVALRRQLGLRV